MSLKQYEAAIARSVSLYSSVSRSGMLPLWIMPTRTFDKESNEFSMILLN